MYVRPKLTFVSFFYVFFLTFPLVAYVNTLQVCCVLVFWSVHQLLLKKLLSPSSLLAAMALALLVLGLHRRLTLGSSLLRGLSTTLLFSIIGFALSPVLSKLTDSISTDTIHRFNLTISFYFCWQKLSILVIFHNHKHF